MPLTSTEILLNKFVADTVSEAQRNLGSTTRKVGVRAKWEGGHLAGFRKRFFKGRSDASGALRKSISGMVRKGKITFSMLDYGTFVDSGRKPGKGIPINAMQQWIKAKGLRPRDLKTGRIKKSTPQNLRTMGYLMNRKIKVFGIEPTYFFTDALDNNLSKLEKDLADAISIDVVNKLGK